MLKVLFGLLAALADWFRNRQLIDAGKAEQANAATVEIERRAEKARQVADAVDPVRDERLRDRFDRSRGGE